MVSKREMGLQLRRYKSDILFPEVCDCRSFFFSLAKYTNRLENPT